MFDPSVAGIHANLEMLNSAARNIARSGETDSVDSTVEMMVAEHGLEANVAALRTMLSMSASIIDLLA